MRSSDTVMWPARFASSQSSSSQPLPVSPPSNLSKQHLQVGNIYASRPDLSPRSSSLDLKSKGTASTPNLYSQRFTPGSGLRQELSTAAARSDLKDPLRVLGDIVGSTFTATRLGKDEQAVKRPDSLVQNIAFEGRSLLDFDVESTSPHIDDLEDHRNHRSTPGKVKKF